MRQQSLKVLAITGLFAVLAACGGSGDSDSQGRVSVGVTDAPMGGADRVVVEFSAIEFKPQSGPSFTIELTNDDDEPSSQQIDLLELQGTASELLIDAELVPAGRYNWMRLHIIDNPCDALEPGDDPAGSFIDLTDGGIEPLHIPSGSQSGLKVIKNFVIAAGGVTDLTVDFDVRKSVVKAGGQECHFLKPVLRVVDNLEVGDIQGTVSAELIDPEAVCAVYLFDAADEVDDLDGIGDPLTTALVNFENDAYRYEIGFVPAGSYKLALTCDVDDPEVDNDLEGEDPVTFTPEAPASFDLSADETVTVDI